MKFVAALLAAALSIPAALAEDWPAPGGIVLDPNVYLISAEDMTVSADGWATCPGHNMPTIAATPDGGQWIWRVTLYCGADHPQWYAIHGDTAPGCKLRPVIERKVGDHGRWRAWIHCPDSTSDKSIASN